MRTLYAATLALVSLAALLGGPAAAQNDAVQNVTIAVVGPMAMVTGQSTRDAALFAVERINKGGLRIDGKNVVLKLVMIDDKNDPNLALIGARAAVAAGAVGVIGHLTTDASIAASRVYNEAGIPQISPTAAGKGFIQQGYANVFQMLGQSDFAAQYLAETAVKVLRAKRILLVDNDTALGKVLAASFAASVARLAGNIADTDKINRTSSDFNSITSKIKNGHIDLIFFAGVVPQSTAFAVRLRQLGISTPLLLAGGAINPDFPRRTEEYPEGTLVLLPGNPVEKVADFKRLEKMYHEKYKAPLIPQTWMAYDAVELLVEAMKRSNSVNPRMLSPALHQLKFAGLSGNISFAADGSLDNPRYTLYRAEQQTWKVLNTLP